MITTKFMVQGPTVSIISLDDKAVLDSLPPQIYAVQFDKMIGFFLTIIKDRLEVPSVIYGSVHNRVEKCIKTYQDRNTSTGILLTGDKGTGKTLMMSLLANRVVDDLNLPVVLIKEPYSGDQFTMFIEQIGECCLVFDEFGKMYSNNSDDDSNQNSLLSLMDGVDKTKRLILLTENRETDINEFMLNRPSRVYYHFKYTKLDRESIEGYCKDHNVELKVQDDILDLSHRLKIFSFDMLQAIVEEHKRFGEDISDITKELNIDVRETFGASIEIVSIIDKNSGERCQLASDQSVKVTKPVKWYTTYVTVNRGRLTSNMNTQTAPIDLDCDDDNDTFDVSFEDSNLAYETIDRLVYETTTHTVTAKPAPVYRTDYRNMAF